MTAVSCSDGSIRDCEQCMRLLIASKIKQHFFFQKAYKNKSDVKKGY